MMIILLAAGLLVCAFQSIRAKRLLPSAIWLAGASAVLSITFYLLGATQLAVFELSIGAGLVTVLFVFAISIAGEDAITSRAVIPKPLAWGLVLLSLVLMGWFIIPIETRQLAVEETGLTTVFWHQRALDLLVQIVQIFSGVLGLLGLLAEAKAPLSYPVAEEVAERGKREIDAMAPSILQEEEA